MKKRKQIDFSKRRLLESRFGIKTISNIEDKLLQPYAKPSFLIFRMFMMESEVWK